ncbi:MAG: type IV pilus biogenesis/stability protein PilW [Pseudomonadales bacterium]
MSRISVRMGVAVLGVLLLSSGCVTESTGGLPKPATASQRVQAQLDLARGYLEQGATDRARTALNKALEIDSKSVEAYVLLGVLNAAESDYGLAEKHFRTALGINPKDAMALNNYASFLYARKRYDEAVRYLRVLVQDPGYRARSQAYENLGLAELKVNDVQAAKESFTRALQLSFTQPISNLELAQIAFDDGDIKAAATHYDAFRAQAQQSARSLCLGMKIASRQGDTDRMASYALAMNNLYPNARETRECVVSP